MGDTWEEHRIYVVNEIKDIKTSIKENRDDVQEIQLAFSVLNTKILTGAALISTVVAIAVPVILKFL